MSLIVKDFRFSSKDCPRQFEGDPVMNGVDKVYLQRPVSQENIAVIDPKTREYLGKPEIGVMYPMLRHTMTGYTQHHFKNACILHLFDPDGVAKRDVGLYCLKEKSVILEPRFPSVARLIQS